MRSKMAIKRGLGACVGACLLSGSSMLAASQQWAFVWYRWLHLRAAADSEAVVEVQWGSSEAIADLAPRTSRGQRSRGIQWPALRWAPQTCWRDVSLRGWSGCRKLVSVDMIKIYHPEYVGQRLIAMTPILLALPFPLLSIPVIFCFTNRILHK